MKTFRLLQQKTMKTSRLLACLTLAALTACADIDDSVNMEGADTGAFLTSITLSDATGRNVTVKATLPPLTTDANGREQLKDPADTEILVKVRPTADLTQLKPVATLSATSAGASISPKMGTLTDFSSPRTYTVTSYDKKTKTTYTLRVTQQ